MTTSPGSAPEPPATDRAGEPAERWGMAGRRVVQAVLDWALAVGIGVFAALGAGLVAIPLVRWGFVPPKLILWAPAVAFLAVTYACDIVIQIWVPVRRGGSTPGMLVMGLRVQTLRGGQPKARAYLIRWVLLTVDGLLLGLVAVVSIVATQRRQRIGDLVARTLVVRAERA
ncbi:RDD family protein [Amycolatopsis sp. NPDC101161]|uniref:RDD family protein n=1 Tax=Amycolatopsis sp. NPDC101161 TaxID=3363940 RepID=UPI00382FE7B1